ncbi:YbjN domain-containing protein [Sphingosinicella rhizophila]|uniref:YbjN domain-containing protein n=1 Tax=Sphingosinicella rhizophila TaxID=3050082 RepID=A0ABU3Q223_9SPHN|nr:YbjN domain-containing protein [Sphingosinicella sp. GR2756]MDT9597474.1 YbjN domain-containing protein [Sphingosinicella sp. GR2756]
MKSVALIAAGLLAFQAAPAAAEMVMAQDPESLVKAMQAEGYAAKLGTDKLGDPMITSGASGTAFRIFFYNCKENKDCATVQFSSGYDFKEALPLEKINEWNSRNRFGRAYLDKENDPVLEMDVDLDDGGMSRELFIDNVEFWTIILGNFERHIGYRN